MAGNFNISSGKVAVLLSTYNGEKYLDELLLSLKEQEWPDISLIVRDDQSSDKTLQVLKRNQSNNKKNNFTILPSGDHLGAARSFLNLLSEAGDGFNFYAFSDQDDVWSSDKISRAVNKLYTVSQLIPAFYCSRLEYVDEDLNHLRFSRIPRQIGFGNAIVENVATGCTVVMNKVARELILSGLPDKLLMHDWWCYLTISCFGRVLFDDYPGIKYRQHATNAIGAATEFSDDLNRRVRRIFKSEDGVFRFSDQVRKFIENFRDRIPEEQHRILNLVLSGKSSIKDRIRLAASGEIWRQRWGDDAILRILILMNRY
jgi:glycosyltransferase involved in cell wall biosynthesis